jgi:hypothetical protein
MIELDRDGLVFRFPEVHEDAVLRVGFQRTLRIPDDGRDYALPPGLGNFPMRHVDDFAKSVPDPWLRHGGLMLPMYQSEALWLDFNSPYPFAVKIAAGKINAVTGQAWSERLQRDPQDYVVIPEQPWLDGFCVEKGVIRQFVAMPLGSGYSAEEQITGESEFGGIQILAYPLKAKHYVRARQYEPAEGLADYCRAAPSCEMGLSPGGRMTQKIYDDDTPLDHWDQKHSSRCFVHLTNSLVWRQITGDTPPTVPPTVKEYTAAGLPWFDYYADSPAVRGSKTLAKLKSVVAMGKAKGDVPLPENESVTPETIVRLRKGLVAGQVREGRF